MLQLREILKLKHVFPRTYNRIYKYQYLTLIFTFEKAVTSLGTGIFHLLTAKSENNNLPLTKAIVSQVLRGGYVQKASNSEVYSHVQVFLLLVNFSKHWCLLGT